jgi:hypothetical protein
MTKDLDRLVPFISLERLMDSGEMGMNDVYSDDFSLVSEIRLQRRICKERHEKTQNLLAEQLGLDPKPKAPKVKTKTAKR